MPLYSADAPEFSVNSEQANDQSEPAVAALADGGFVIVWETAYSAAEEALDTDDEIFNASAVIGQLFDAAGNPVGDEFLVNTEFSYYQADPDVTGLADGGFVVTWSSYDDDVDGDDYGIAAQMYGVDGEPVGSEFTVNTQTENSQYGSTITALEDGGFVITWYSGDSDVDGDQYGISGQIYDANGNEVGGEFTVNTEIEGSQYAPSVAALADGGFVITWHGYDADIDEDMSGISAQVYDANGTAVGSEFQVNAIEDEGQYKPAVTGLSGGGFVITWYSDEPDEDADDGDDAEGDGDGRYVSAQIFDADGNTVGDELLVNSSTEGDQTSPSITALEDGGFVITWTTDDASTDGSGAAVVGQIFDEQGNKVGDEFIVNSETDNHQLVPNMATLEDGSFVVSWTTFDEDIDGNGTGIAARVFSDNGLEGTQAADTLEGTSGNDYSFSYGGNDVLWGQEGSDTLNAGDGNDLLRGDAGNDILYAGSGDDEAWAGANDAGADTVFGGSGDDEIAGGAGNDLLVGGIFSDGDFDHFQLNVQESSGAGSGADTLYGAEGDDTLVAGDWHDGDMCDDGAWQPGETDVGSAGDAWLWGGTGDDYLVSGAGDDVLSGGANSDVIDAGAGNDTIHGGTGYNRYELNDQIEAGSGHDVIYAGDGDDSILGGSGNDNIFSGSENDTVYGGAGDDTLWGGSGNDYFYGGDGADVFVYSSGHGTDRIQDFNVDEDTLDLSGAGFSDLSALSDAASQANGGVTIEIGDESLVLLNVVLEDLDAMNITYG